ncbi:MAG: MarR family winged helix-turn-helix transcriptional regulator [Bacillota bacterium]|nr:MarR family winged helix-turn-helix transcriptional regulator [Bacillota bacterium]
MDYTKHTLNELLVGLFNYILYIEEKNLKNNGVKLSMNEVHLLESIQKASDNTMSHIAKRSMITQGTLTTNIKGLVKKGYVERYKDENDGRIVRLRTTELAKDVLYVHDQFHALMIDKVVADLKLEENKILLGSLEKIMDYFSKEYDTHFE